MENQTKMSAFSMEIPVFASFSQAVSRDETDLCHGLLVMCAGKHTGECVSGFKNASSVALKTRLTHQRDSQLLVFDTLIQRGLCTNLLGFFVFSSE